MKRDVLTFKIWVKAQDTAARVRALVLAAYWPGLEIDDSVRIYSGTRVSCAPGGRIKLTGTKLLSGVTLEVSEGAVIEIGKSIIGRSVVISARERITVGDKTGIADMSTLRDHDHTWSPDLGSDRTSWNTTPISVGESAWLGAKVTVTRGVDIGDGAVVGAGAVVTKSVEKYTISVGVPAARIK